MWTHYKGKNGKKTSRREREGGGKKGENKIKLESEEERRARLREKQVIQGERDIYIYYFRLFRTRRLPYENIMHTKNRARKIFSVILAKVEVNGKF